MQKINTKVLLIVALFLVVFSIYQKQGSINIPIPNNPIVVPNKPEIKTNIFYDEYDKARQIATEYDKKLLLIFGADWCPYCRDIKRDVKDIKGFQKYIVCFIDTDKNKDFVRTYKIKGLPTSLVLDEEDNEISRKTGYKNKDYENWLDSNFQEGSSWLNIDTSF